MRMEVTSMQVAWMQVGWIGIARRYLAMPIDTHTELHSKAIRTPSSPLLLSHIYERTWLHRHSESIGVPIVCGAEATRYAYQSEGGEGNGSRTRHRRGKSMSIPIVSILYFVPHAVATISRID